MDDKLKTWVKTQRIARKRGTLSEEKIALLDSIGFDWGTDRKIVSLEEANPEIAAEWHQTKNKNLLPSQVSSSNMNKVWWQCKNGHEWEATICSRVAGRGCPVCAGRMVITGYNDLASRFPEIAQEWHPTKNGNLNPADVVCGSGKKVWWLCPEGHEYFASINGRTCKRHHGCPFCSKHRKIPGFNDLATKYPDIAAEWHPTKNGSLTAEDVTAGSGKKVWWQCKEGHEWQARINNRTRGVGCPVCVGRRQRLSAELAAEWHPTKNGSLTAEDVTAGSKKKVWWQCKEGHEWQASIGNRTSGKGCPFCARLNHSRLSPELVAEWHPTKNGSLTAEDVSAGSSKKVWWLCKKGHEWQAPIYNRTRGKGCPVCAAQKRKVKK